MSADYHAIFPKSAPSGMSITAYDSHVKAGQCARLLRGECSHPCGDVDEDGGYQVDFDHILARSGGGDDADWNLEPKCSGYNRWGKRAGSDEYFSEASFFDLQINHTMLRKNQYTHGYSMVKNVYKDKFNRIKNDLLRFYMLLAWQVGTGKTLGMLSVLHAINEVINEIGPGRPRIMKVLWLVHQQSLVKSIEAEIKSEPVKYGILTQEPRTAIVQCAEDWDRVTPNADIVLACPQSLWDTKTSRLTMTERENKLKQFHAIVIDEGHYAIEQYISILSLAPMALKFVATATPCDAGGTMLSKVEDGKYRHLFRAFSAFGYSSARRELFVKEVFDWQEGLNNGNYYPVEAGESFFVECGSVVNGENNTANRHNSPRTNHIIKRAIDKAAQIKEFPAHVMVRCESINRLKSLLKSIQEAPSEYFPDGDGWGACGIYSGSKGLKIDNPNHPWMIVKKKGKIEPISARVVLAVDMGQFGVNNPFCSVVAWTDPNMSIIELVQRIGRAIRIVKGVDPRLQSVKLVFPDNPLAVTQMEKAVRFLLEMEERVEQEFISLDEAVEAEGGILIDSPASMLSSLVKFQVNEAQGITLPDGLQPEDIQILAQSLDPENSDELTRGIQDYVDKLQSESYKDSQFGLPGSAETLVFVHQEKPKEIFSLAEIQEFVKANYSSAVASQIIEDLLTSSENSAVIVSMVSEDIRKQHAKFNRPSTKFFSVQELLGIQAKSDLLDRQEDTYFGRVRKPFEYLYCQAKNGTGRCRCDDCSKLTSIISQSLYESCKQVFGLKSFRQEDYAEFESQLSSAMCSKVARKKIVDRAKALVIEKLKNRMQGHYALYVNQIAQFTGAVRSNNG